MNYLICGGSCSGKSTFSELLSSQLNMKVYHIDDHIDEDHKDKFNDREHPVNYRITQEGIYWLFDLPVNDYVHTNIKAANEDLEFVKKDIEDLKENMIIDGIWADPDLVQSTFPDSKIIWLFPAEAHQKLVWKSREWTKYVLSEHRDPEKALENWISGDYATSVFLEKRVTALNLSKYILNNNLSIIENFNNIKSMMGL